MWPASRQACAFGIVNLMTRSLKMCDWAVFSICAHSTDRLPSQ